MSAFSATIANRSYLSLLSPVMRSRPLVHRCGLRVFFGSSPFVFVATWFDVSHSVDFLIACPVCGRTFSGYFHPP